MSKCKDCQKYNTCGTREVFGSLSCNDGFVPKKQTNADKIRSMNDEELTEFLKGKFNCCNYCKVKNYENCTVCDCKKSMMTWLQSEVSE